MTHLYALLQRKVEEWRRADYPLSDYPALAEVFDYARLPETGILRFLRPPQFRALETYWYLRLVEGTPHITGLYARHFPKASERQVPGNTHKARIYLSQDNYRALDNQLQETYGEHLSDLNRTSGHSRRARIVVRKVDLPPLVVRRLVQTVVPREAVQEVMLSLVRPEMTETEPLIS